MGGDLGTETQQRLQVTVEASRDFINASEAERDRHLRTADAFDLCYA
jgi:polyisoprenoid-binding protein YceI